MMVLRSHADGAPRVYRAAFADHTGRIFSGIVKRERVPEMWWNEFEVYYVHGPNALLADVLGHIVGGVFCAGLPPLVPCDAATSTARDPFGNGTSVAPAPGLCPVMLKDCGRTVAELVPHIGLPRKLQIAASLVNAIRELTKSRMYVTDLKLENVCADGERLVFIDPGSIVCGKAIPVTSLVLLANWLRFYVPKLPSLEASLRAFAAEHTAADDGHCIEAPIRDIVGLSAKLALAQIFGFDDAALAFFQPIEAIFEPVQTKIRVCVGHRASDFRDFVHFFPSAEHLVV